MNPKLFILLFFYLCFDSIYSLSSTTPISIPLNDKKEFKVSGTEQYIATRTEEEGLIAFELSVSKSHSSLKDKIFYIASNSLSFEGESFKKAQEVEYSGESKIYRFLVQVKEKQYAIVKITGLTNGETISVETQYASNGLALGVIIAIVIVALIILCLICCVLKKCFC